MTTRTATFGAGCFWGVEELYRTLDGVEATCVGYMGGHIDNPTYQAVCTDTTGHAEVVQIAYNPHKVEYGDLVDIFFDNHNPTQLNMQGPDVGSQYRSVIFFDGEDQKAVAEEKLSKLKESGRFARPIVTVIEKAQTMWEAEEYHQQYLAKRGMTSCHI
ncbi:peptide-methionine (S)-S-oxide reductase MsrA [Temperatibacter marinus]|uniref:Peptide methionine sulfoxide reductase MsrA n=1 Tax=Temperatibacter marinus TaxID=1456591 RepID=A0AA52EGV9_9PROT|nr:peptide-methionine (S)-S-oxide reductase MsrA [Temperatibacter marinus]WND01841.1 peptide-methionine (S)-S-oxide reductase MsrA [Temperatibacter marinus]